MARPHRIAALTHGCSKEPWYQAWKTMKRRCENPNDPNYRNYGGKGIAVCEEWKDPLVFGKWASESGYEVGLTIDRIDNDGNYCPENCRWATHKEQANNRSTCVYYEFDGESHTLAEWAEIAGINRFTLWSRVNKQGWSIERALTEPVASLRPKGEWIQWSDDKFMGYGADGKIRCRKYYTYECCFCGRNVAVKSNFCPNCGADMKGEV